MSELRDGPPDWEKGGGPNPGTARHHHPHKTTGHHPSSNSDGTSRRPYSGCHATVWRQVYARGFRDALRLAERRLGPEAWLVLSALADEYDLASIDG
jgi:hypothetical protein